MKQTGFSMWFPNELRSYLEQAVLNSLGPKKKKEEKGNGLYFDRILMNDRVFRCKHKKAILPTFGLK